MGAFEVADFQCGIQSAAEPANYLFFTNDVVIEVTNDGSDLDCLQVTDIPFNHMNATSGIQTNRYWIINGFQADRSTIATQNWTVNMTLTHNATADADDKVCRYTGVGVVWDCVADSFVGTTITRNNITQFSDWATGNNVGPTAVTLSNLTTNPASPWLWLASGLVLLGGTAVGLRRRRVA